MRNIEILREILKLIDKRDEAYRRESKLHPCKALATIRELIAAERPTLVTEQDAHNKDQLKLEGIE